MSVALTHRKSEGLRRGLRFGEGIWPGTAKLWALCFAFVLALHLGAAAALLSSDRDFAEGLPSDAINVDLLPELSDAPDKPDDVAGPQVTESIAATSSQMDADDPDPPAPDSLPPTEVEQKLKVATPELTAPAVAATAEAVLSRPVEHQTSKLELDANTIDKPEDAERAKEERQTAASRASAGSAGLLGGGKRPSAAAEATWRGALGAHLVHFRRFPPEARAAGMQGIAKVRVTIDTDGHVLSRDILKSTGHAQLDREALDMMNRSDPLPRPPPSMMGPIVLVVPVNFAIR